MITRSPAEKPRQVAHGAFAKIQRFKEKLRAEEQAAAEKRVRAQELADERARSAQPWERDRWLADCREARRKLEGSLATTTDDPLLRRIEQELTNCGTEIGVLVCRQCRTPQLGTGNCAVRAGAKLCNRLGCPLSDAEDRAHRARTLPGAIDHIRRRTTGMARRLASHVAAMERHRDPRKRKGRRVLADRKAAIARIGMSDWFAFEVRRHFHVNDSDRKLFKRFTRALKTLSGFVARLWRERFSGDGTELDTSAFGAWIEQPVLGTITLRGVYFGPEFSIDELSDLLHSETRQSEVTWMRRVEPEQTPAWAAILSSGADSALDAATFAEGWHCNQPRHAIPPRLALLWSAAAVRAGLESAASSYGLLREYYRPISDGTRPQRFEKGRCPECRAEVRFDERVVASEWYLRRCHWYGRTALAPRDFPPEPEGTSSEWDCETRTVTARGSSSEDD